MSYDAAPQAPAASTPRRKKWLIALVALVVLVVGGLTAGVLMSTGSSGPSYPKAWDPRIAPLAAIAAKDRDLTFEHPIYVEFLTSAQFDKTVTQESGSLTQDERDQLNQQTGAYRALGLISDKVDLLKATNDLNAAGILAYYSNDTKRAYVRGTVLTPAIKVTLVHELTHALQDQHFNITKTFSTLDASKTESDSAFRSIVEGDAVRVQYDYQDSLPAAVRKQVDAENQAVGKSFSSKTSAIPAFMEVEQSAPYDLGLLAVRRTLAAGGESALNSLFQKPPTQDIQLIEPWTMSQPWSLPQVQTPALASGEKRLGGIQLGAFELYLTLAGRIPTTAALNAASQWGNDKLTVYHGTSGICVNDAIAGSSSSGASIIESALKRWVAATPGSASVSSSHGTVLLNACDPHGRALASPSSINNAYYVLLTRNEIEAQVEKQGSPEQGSICYANAIIEHFDVAALHRFDRNVVTSTERNEFTQLARSCFE